MLRHALRLAVASIGAVSLLAGCYKYVPMNGGDLILGAAYRGHLTPEGSQRVAPLVGQDVARFDARIVSVLDTAFLVAMGATVRRGDPRQQIWTGEQVLIPRVAVNKFELRELDRPRTIRAAAYYTVGMFAAAYLWFRVRGGAGGTDGIDQPPPP